MGNPFGSLWNDVKQGTGTALNQGADLLGDGLNAVGLTGAAVAVDTLGDKAGYSLGADVPELQLGQTSDPAELVHGDPAAIRSSAAQLRTFSSAFGETSAGLKGLDTAHWTGSAADAFRAKFAPHPAKWQDASSATGTTSAALESYAGAVESAQGQATRAIGLYAQGQQATAAAQAAYNQQVAAYNSAAQAYNAQLAAGQNPGTPPAEPGPFSDPGEAMRQDAQQILLEARSARDSEAAAASAAIRPATGLAPAEPSFWSQLGSDFSDAMQVGNLASISLVGGAVDGVADIAKFARSIDPADSWNMEHPAEYVAGLSGTAAGLANDVINPQDLVKSLVGSGWGSDPAQALGRLVPNIALAVGTDGAGAAADAGTSIAERAALGTGEDAAAAGLDGVASDPAAAARPPADIPTAGDPVDVATGDVVLAQTDVTLPGLLPLVVERMHRSSWRAGRWFGRSWASTFDQRLQVRADRVIGAFADGRVLIWPQSREDGAGCWWAVVAGVADGAGASRAESTRPMAGANASGVADGASVDGSWGRHCWCDRCANGVAGARWAGAAQGETPAVLPVTGAPWPLRREPDGAWTVTDRQRGLVWRFARRQGYFFSGGQGELPLVAVSDRAGHEIRFGYDEAGTPAWVWHSGGYLVRVNVTDGRVTSLALGGPDGGNGTAGRDGGDGGDAPLISYGYDEDGNLASVVNSSGEPLRYSYDEAGRLTGWQDRNGHFYRYGYDGQGRCVRGEGSGQALSGTYRYHPDARVTTWTDVSGAVTTYRLSGCARVAAITGPLGHSTGWEHDARGRVIACTDPLGRVTRYRYDTRGNVTTVTRPDGSQVHATYDERSLPVRVADPAGHTWQQEYDARGNRTQVTAPDGAVTRFSYDDHGHLASVTDPAGGVTLVACDRAGLPVAVTGPDGARARCERDRLGRVSRITGPDGGITSLTWTPEGRLSSRTLPDGTAEFWSYDGEGNLTRHLSPGAGLTRYEYGPFDQLVAMTAPDGSRSEFGYDHALRLTTVEHGGLTWHYDYDPAGRLLAETDYNGATTRYAYDAAGQLTSQLNACGQRITFGYDQLGNVTERNADGVPATFGYDVAGLLVYARNPDAEVWLDRDEAGRVTAETCNGRTLTSEYDAAGRRRRRVTPFGAVTQWDFDPAGQPVMLTAAGQQIRFGYDPAGRETRRELPGGLVLAQAWDQRGRLTMQALTAQAPGAQALAAHAPGAGGLPDGVGPLTTGPGGPPEGPVGLPEGTAAGGQMLQRRAYAYSGDGFVTAIDDLLAGSRRFGLDQAGRVTTVNGPGWGESYAYDPAGNVSAATWPAPPPGAAGATPGPAGATPGPDAQGPREVRGTLITRAGNVRYRHDRQGRVIQRQVVRISRKPDTWHYYWDADSRLAAVRTPDHTTWRYRYDPFGRRIAKQRLTPDGDVAEQTDFTWDGAVLAEQATTTAQPGQHQVITWDYRPGSFTPLTQAEHTSPGELSEAPQEQIDQRFYSIIADLIGTPAELAAPDGTLAGSQRHTLWGTTVWDPGGAQTPLRFPGQYADQETGLHYNQHRYYDPAAGSYLTPDPLGLAPAPNPHAYVPNPQVLPTPSAWRHTIPPRETPLQEAVALV